MASVYGLYSSGDRDHIRYVGITKYEDATLRLLQHISAAKRPRGRGSDWPVYRWMRKHILEGHSIEFVLFADNISWNDACAMEVELIAHFRSLHVDLLNITDGGDGRMGAKHSDETKRKMSDAAKERLKSPEAREKIAEAMRTRVVSEETRRKISEAGKRRTHGPLTEEHKKKIGDAHRGRKYGPRPARGPLTEEHKKKISNTLTGQKRGPTPEEVKKKISDARKKHNAKKREEHHEQV